LTVIPCHPWRSSGAPSKHRPGLPWPRAHREIDPLDQFLFPVRPTELRALLAAATCLSINNTPGTPPAGSTG